uniref:Uncharacterized protein n=1 Tax=Romanomermis culicivorax TaxID=13658 RepID=A0A915IYK7_ROMCU
MQYISLLQPDAEVQCQLELPKNLLLKPIFTAPQSPATPIDIKPPPSMQSLSAPMMMVSLLNAASMLPPLTAITSTTATTSTISKLQGSSILQPRVSAMATASLTVANSTTNMLI